MPTNNRSSTKAITKSFAQCLSTEEFTYKLVWTVLQQFCNTHSGSLQFTRAEHCNVPDHATPGLMVQGCTDIWLLPPVSLSGV